MAKLPESFLMQLKDNSDIVSLAENYVELKRSGSTFSCRCPFHSERTPSCHFYPATNSFHCFGCHAGGDVVTFTMMIENLEYMDAIRFLAQRANMTMPEDAAYDGGKSRRRMYEMNRTAGKYFHQKLFSPEGREAMEYLTRRGLTEHTIRRFGLGYAADNYHDLHFYMRSQGFSDDELADGALLKRNVNKYYDKFRHRVMFPIFDTNGNIIGFGGRALRADDPAKYLNSDETYVFHKRDNLYALNYAKNSKEPYFILCEGYMDVIAMHQAGFTGAVATLGTAVTPAQARLIQQKGKPEVILSYDSDAAGQAAASRAMVLLSDVGLKVKTLKITGAKDPDEFILKFGAEAFRHLINSSGSAMDAELEKLKNGLDLESTDDKTTYLRRVKSFLAQIKDPLARETYISKVAKEQDIDRDTMRRSVESEIRFNQNKQAKKERSELIRPRTNDKINPDSHKFPREERAERNILCYLFHNPEKLGMIKERLTGGFATELNGKIFGLLAQQIEQGYTPDLTLLGSELTVEQMGRITEIITDSDFAYDTDVLNDCINTLNEYNESQQPVTTSEMTDEELRELMQKQLQKLKKKS